MFVPHTIHRNLHNKSYGSHFYYQILEEGPFVLLFNLLSLKNVHFMLVSLQIENFSDVELIYGIKNHDLTMSLFGTLLLKNFLLKQYFKRLLIVSKTNFAR